jgi:DnaK suppressor protein
MNPKRLLLECLETIRRDLRSREGLTVEETAEEIEKVRNQADRDLEVAKVNRATGTMREIMAALARVDEGAYGVCVECDESISPRRLSALPWASRCLQCQEKADLQTPVWQEDLAA